MWTPLPAPIRGEDHLRQTVNYIEWNPVVAKLAARPEEYRFSSAHGDAETDIEAFFRA
jgi:hypothetical protein